MTDGIKAIASLMVYFLNGGIETKNANTLKNVGRIIDNMNKKITMLEIINKIANNEDIPKRIKYKDKIYIYSETDQDYLECDKDDFDLLGCAFYNLRTKDFINDKVEILEEDKDIEEIKIENDNPTHFYIRDEKGTKCGMTKHSKMIAEKVNEVIREVNKLRKEDKEDEKNN